MVLRRPFRNVAETNAVLVAAWNCLVGPHDTVHVLGDVAMGRREEPMSLVSRLAGHKIFYPGSTAAAGTDTAGGLPASSRREYVDAGFDEIRQGPLTMTAGNREVLACHLPYRGDSGSCRRGDFQENPSHGGGEGAAAAGRMTRVSAAGVSFSVVHRPVVL
ncbi:MAG: hypothetical protein ACYCSX_14450 [Acidimicrobiales bacterium]